MVEVLRSVVVVILLAPTVGAEHAPGGAEGNPGAKLGAMERGEIGNRRRDFDPRLGDAAVEEGRVQLAIKKPGVGRDAAAGGFALLALTAELGTLLPMLRIDVL